jgi:hypothetical protein
MPNHQPQSLPPTKPAPEPSPLGSLIQPGRLRWLRCLPLRLSRHATASTVPGFKGRADRPARQPEEGSSVPGATVSFAGNLTADPEVRYTESGLQGDDEIGRTSLYDAEGKMRHPSALDHPRALQVDRLSA